MELLCPLCGKPLMLQEKTYICVNRHSFDVARQGYVNLLAVQQKHSAHPGDTREQVLARRRFLDAGFYAPLAQAICDLAREYGCTGPVLDAGCGEGYYSAQLATALNAPLIGLDISKEAVRCAAGRHKSALWLCASAAHMPVPTGSVSTLTSLFSITAAEEFRRVLRPDGTLIQVLAGEDHLLGLKSIIYPQLLHKEKHSQPELPGFTLVRSQPVRFTFTVTGEQVQDLLAMTPHVYRISKAGAQALRQTRQLTDTASCIINLYRPIALSSGN